LQALRSLVKHSMGPAVFFYGDRKQMIQPSSGQFSQRKHFLKVYPRRMQIHSGFPPRINHYFIQTSPTFGSRPTASFISWVAGLMSGAFIHGTLPGGLGPHRGRSPPLQPLNTHSSPFALSLSSSHDRAWIASFVPKTQIFRP